jgi:RHS repeat-associated protein
MAVFAILLTVSLGVSATVSIRHRNKSLAALAQGNPQANGQSATLLPNGNWLLLGGLDSDGNPQAGAWIRNGQTGSVNALNSHLLTARAWHTATVLPNGMILILGGVGTNGKLVGSAELFDWTTGTFAPMPSTGLMARAHHTATVLTDGTLFVAGGIDADGTVTGRLEEWSFQSGLSTTLNTQLLIPREGQTATLLADGTVLLWGGTNPTRGEIGDGEIFDPLSEGIQIQTSLPPSLSNSGESQLAASIPANDATGVSVNAWIAFRFSAPLSVTSVNVNTVSLSSPTGSVPALVVPAEKGMLVFVTPSSTLEAGTEYQVVLDGLADSAGNVLPNQTFNFTTAGTAPVAILPVTPFTPTTGSQVNNTPQNLPPLQAPPGVTALAGQSLQLNGQPLANVTLEINNTSTETDQTGRFLLQLPALGAGHYAMIIDGHTADSKGQKYGVFEVGVNLQSGVTTALSYTIWMTPLDIAHAVSIPSPTVKETVITTPVLPGLEFHIPANTIIRDWKGKAVTKISITQIPLTQPPFPLPNVPVPIYFTIQPGAGSIDVQGVPPWTVGGTLIYPNTYNSPPGSVYNFWNYDPNGQGWWIYGQGKVSSNKKSIIPNPGVQIYTLTGAMVGSQSLAPATAPPPGNINSKGGEPVDLSTGLFVYNHTDLAVSDILPITLTRTYRPADGQSHAFGIGASHPYDMFLVGNAPIYSYTDLILPDGESIQYEQMNPNFYYDYQDLGVFLPLFENTNGSTPFYGSQITWRGPQGGATAWVLKLKDGTTMYFPDDEYATSPQQGGCTGIVDRYGNTLTINRNTTTGQISSITTPNARSISFTYDSDNRITQAQDNIGRTVSYQYNSAGYLSQFTDANGGITQYTYDQNGNMTSIQDPRGITYLTNVYDSQNRVIKQIQADSSTYQFTYNGSPSSETDVTDPRGNVRKVMFNGNGYTTQDIEASGLPEQQTTSYSWNTTTNLLQSVTDPAGYQTNYTYDSMADITSITTMYGTSAVATTSFTYEPNFFQLSSITDALGDTTSFGFDGNGNVTSIEDPMGDTTTFSYNSVGQPITVTDPVQDPPIQFLYDSGDLAAITDSLGRTTNLFHDGVGRLLTITNPLNQVTHYAYDGLNDVTQVVDPGGNATQMTYDPNGNLLTVKDARNNTTTYSYDGFNRLVLRADPLGRVETYQYDSNGNLTAFTDRRGTVTNFQYDGMNRRTFAGFGGPTYQSTISYTYDSLNRLLQASDSVTGTTARQYNDVTNSITETTTNGSVAYAFDSLGRRTSMTVSGQSPVNYFYDSASRLTGIAQGNSAVSFSYDADSRRSSLTLPNGIVASYGYDAASELTGLTYTLNSNTLGNLIYTYDQAGRRASVGGSLAQTGVPLPVTSASYDAANELTQWGTASPTYDANGNTLSDGTNTYVWNARNQLTSMNLTGDSFQYDPFGRRTSKTILSTTTNYLYDNANPVQELSGTTPTANLLTGSVDEYFTRTDSTGTATFVNDALGSTVQLTNSSGSEIAQYAYEPFGNTAVGGTSTNSYQFTGRENDGTGVYYYRGRYYDPYTERFLSEDPARLKGGSANFYSYVSSSPLNRVDPSGYCPQQPSKTSLLNCATTVADETSLAGYFNLGDGPLTQAVLGNTWSGAISVGQEVLNGQFGGAATDLALGGYGQGIIPGGGLARGGVVGTAQDAFFNSITGEGSQLTTLNLSEAAVADTSTAAADVSLATIVSAAKLAWDSYALAYGVWHCW